MKNKTFALFPCFSISSIYTLDFEKLYQKGYRALLFDIDNTLVLHDEPAREETIALFQRMKAAGFKTAVLSNNGVERVGAFQDRVHADLVIPNAGKPKAKAYLQAVEQFGIAKEQALFFGDQLFTDILGGNRAEVPTVLVKPMGKEKYFHILLKRILEKPFLLAYQRKHALFQEEIAAMA